MTDPDFADTMDPLGLPKAGRSADLDALAAYVASLATFPPSPFRNPDGSMTLAARRGQELFTRLDCQSCHTPPSYTDGLRHDVGTIQPSSGLGIGQPLPGVGFETQTLRAQWLSPHYLHNGQAQRLEQVLNSAAHGGTDQLSAQQRRWLTAYLLQIE